MPEKHARILYNSLSSTETALDSCSQYMAHLELHFSLKGAVFCERKLNGKWNRKCLLYLGIFVHSRLYLVNLVVRNDSRLHSVPHSRINSASVVTLPG
jgi:hypothetical protein